MKNEEVKRMLPYNLQFFAAKGDGDDEPKNDDNQNDDSHDDDSHNDDGSNGEDQNKKEKTFTQSQVNAMMSREKKQGRQAALNALGFKTEDDAKKAIALLNALQDSQKSEEEKLNEKINNQKDDLSEAVKRAIVAENKLSCISANVKKEAIDDVLAIASTKISDEKDLDSVLEEMKKDTKYSSFFEGTKQGTGSNPGHSKQNDGVEKMGARLAKSSAPIEKKSTYF